MPDEPIRVLIVEDHTVFAETMSMALSTQSDMRVVGVAKDGNEAANYISTRGCDVVLMDMRLGDDEGLDVIERLRALDENIAILVLTAVRDARSAAFAVSHGAAGFLTKDVPLHDVIRGIRDSVRGRSVMEPSMATEVLSILSGRRQRVGDNLTKREIEVLRMLDEGNSASDISSSLNISLNTARNHIARIISKLECHSMLEAVSTARREGIIE
ncbi:MAG: response regulator transcription factor [Actinomycetota bacterium]|nr:response regulator transcription factor [Actinomycetota bacterium]